jgi:hypothetical protein
MPHDSSVGRDGKSKMPLSNSNNTERMAGFDCVMAAAGGIICFTFSA